MAESGPFAGRRVVGEINCACWTCETCRRGLHTHCPNRTVLGHPESRRSVRRSDRRAAAQPARRARRAVRRVAVFTEPVAAAFQIPAQIAIRRDGSHHRPWRRPPREPVCAGAGAAVESRAGGRQASARSWRCSKRWASPRRCSRTRIDERSRGHRRGLHRIGDRPADGAEARAPARHDRAEDDGCRRRRRWRGRRS